MIGFASPRRRQHVGRSQNKRPPLLVVFLRIGRLLRRGAEQREICNLGRICGGRRAFISPLGKAETAFRLVRLRVPK